jgi:hypothetical protein
VVQVNLHWGHFVHSPSGASFFSEVDVLMPFFLRLNQLLCSCFPESPLSCSS